MNVISNNGFLEAPLGLSYARTALPIILVMGVNGLLAVTDALFLGHFVGPEAVAAVTLMFPIYMMIMALATLVSGGMSSLLARHLGAGNLGRARAVFAGAHGLALALGAFLLILFALAGRRFALLAAAGSRDLAEPGLVYLGITVLFAPLLFVLAVNSDALRNEGRVGFMAAMSLLVSLANIAFNYVLIARFELGVAGSASGTALAQALAFSIILTFRVLGRTHLKLSALRRHGLCHGWGRMMALGAPQGLNFIGLSLGSAAIIAALQMVGAPNYDQTVSAFGIITRVLTFAFLPLLGLSHAMQTITGHNFGAARFGRSNASLRFALVASVLYCASVQATMMAVPAQIGAVFVDDPDTVAEVARILPVLSLSFVLSGPLMIIAMHFQAIGEAARAGLLGLSKPYLFALPLTFLFAGTFGEFGIWVAGPASDLCLLVLTIVVVAGRGRATSRATGVVENVQRAGQRPEN